MTIEAKRAKRAEGQRRRRAADPSYKEKAACDARERRKRNPMTLEQKEQARLRHKRWRDATRDSEPHRTKLRANYRRWYHRTKLDPQNRLKRNLRARMSNAICRGQKAGSAVRDLGCTISELRTHLEAQFSAGMSWSNHGKWHIDHIKPLASFDLADPDQVRKACHYTNLQPLWASENHRKHASLDWCGSN